jgi:hypothetical protein
MEPSGMRGRVIEKGIPRDKWSKRLDHVRVILVDAEGKDRVYEDSGKPIERIYSARVILDQAEVDEIERYREEARKERARRTSLVAELATDVKARFIAGFPGLTEADFTVSARWDDEEEGAVITSIQFFGKRSPAVKLEGVDVLLKAAETKWYSEVKSKA